MDQYLIIATEQEKKLLGNWDGKILNWIGFEMWDLHPEDSL